MNSNSARRSRPEWLARLSEGPLEVAFRLSPLALVVSAFGLWVWAMRGMLYSVAYFNDSAMHFQMVRFATESLRAGHLPGSQWYPYLNLGSPHFLHYQSLGATVVGLFGVVLTPSVAFRLVTFIAICAWPTAIYWGIKRLSGNRFAAAVASVMAVMVFSEIGVGFEQKSFLWLGYGIWAQLLAVPVLTSAWVMTWRAFGQGEDIWKAALLIAATASLHFEMGYPALFGVAVMSLFAQGSWRQRLATGIRVVIGSLLMMAWVVVPLLVYRTWAPLNAGQWHTPFHMGYGASKNLHWLITGQLFDYGRFPILSIALAVILTPVLLGRVRSRLIYAFLTLTVLLFLVSWGPVTWGSLINFIPGHQDIFFRRFLGPFQLAAMMTAGVAMRQSFDWYSSQLRHNNVVKPTSHLKRGAGLGLTVILLFTGFPSVLENLNKNTNSIQMQRKLEAPQIAQLDPLVSYVVEKNDGRLFLGLPNKEPRQRVGVGPIDLWIVNRDVMQISSQGWAASMMEGPQAMFDDSRWSNYALMAAKYVILPAGKSPGISMNPIMRTAGYVLYEVPNISYFRILETAGTLSADKASISSQAGLTMRSDLIDRGLTMIVQYPRPYATSYLSTKNVAEPAGLVTSSRVNWKEGEGRATVMLTRPANLMFSTSYDPDWEVYVDGKKSSTEIVSPALLSVPLGSGSHSVVFRYRGFRWLLPLIALGLGTLYFLRSSRFSIDNIASRRELLD